ncbi:SDR family NAD(P)-dependent oxidoreductase [Fusibacter ferrireducens]|uniref:3-oxoacyl-ACP reductase FabG n=1 Tax=Fusibacter ferrireducens TaxID=2785058 RepID=A0ABR9ZX56_9FIRM|nr:3-oxoacyl-ACP reductase FabG [Fusibacter ferrireducens]MBF4695049.1 3-oxoacyl-ACP reductase FabG [Fusibacter ferrireducens]
MKLKNKIAIVTGAASGIGYATAKVFLEEGAIVNICDIHSEKVKTTTEMLSQFGTCRGYSVDISNKNQILTMVEQVKNEFGRIDILINNAGITSDAQFYKMSDDQFEKVLDVNLKGTYFFSKAVLPSMMTQQYGKIVHTSSVSAYNGNFGQANYAATKAAIMGMTRVMAKELGKYGITVNAIAPGSIMTDMYKAVPEEIKQKKLASIPLRRYGTPEEAGKLLVFLASDESSYITAQTITIDGGFN